jgi:hypothetical protein
MTNKEALVAVIQISVNDNTLEKALLDQGITSSSNYTAANTSKIDIAAIAVLEGVRSAPDISEGGFSIRYDRPAIERKIEALKHKTGLASGSEIRDASDRW